jgi:hypothetical protein
LDKETKRALKAAKLGIAPPVLTGPIDCACVIHGTGYDWQYVTRLYNMLNRHITPGIRLHVYTEADRPVPEPMIKHSLQDWSIGGPRRSWWYKMQLFDSTQHLGPMLYFDLDVVIVNNIDWIWQLPTSAFWCLRDFKSLWRPGHNTINSSVMWFDTGKFQHVYDAFCKENLDNVIRKYHGDQDYITQAIGPNQRMFFESDRIKSWRWQLKDGGYDFKRRIYLSPNTGTAIPQNTSVLVFHGKPKPLDIKDPVIVQHWQ